MRAKEKEQEQMKKIDKQVVSIPAMEIRHASITLVGDSSLICHAWSQKVKQGMLRKQKKEAQQAKAAKDPEQDFKDSLYPYPGGVTVINGGFQIGGG